MDRSRNVNNNVNNSANTNVNNSVSTNNVNHNSLNSTLFRRTRRAAAMLCAVLAGLGLARGAAAQGSLPAGPLPASPSVPTPYQSPLFHNGGAQDPAPAGLFPFLDSRLQGTPSGVIGGVPTQIPSFLLGAYDPTQPPSAVSGPGNGYYPEHFADGQDPNIFSWEAPFSYLPHAAGIQTEDDNDTAVPTSGPPATAGFTATSGWQKVTGDGNGGSIASAAAGTAANGEYRRLSAGKNGTNDSAVWQLVEPLAGSYTVNVNLPNDLGPVSADPNNPDPNTNLTEPRSTDVTYLITVRDDTGAITFSGNATISQTEANADQFLAGPFQIVAGGSVTVTLKRDSTTGLNYDPKNFYYLVADSISLQVARGDVQSTPTAINIESYPNDFKLLQYWGITTPASSPAPPIVGATAALNAPPDGTVAAPVLRYGDPAKTDARHLIRQLVYFGRREPVLTRSVTLDDSSPTGFSSPFGGFPINDASATNGEYRHYGVSPGSYTPGSQPVASWTLTTPTAVSANGYFIAVHIPRIPLAGQPLNPSENRLGRTTYTVTDFATGALISGPVTINQKTFGTDLIVTLPTGALPLASGQKINVNLFNVLGANTTPQTPPTYVVADSVSLTTGNGQGAIYCVDGFTGGVVWRYETPNSPSAGSAPVYSSPVVAKINVLVKPAGPGNTPPAVYANKLVVIVGDNNGFVYCLDAMGNGDGTSNVNALDANGQAIYAAQPPYGTTAPVFDPANPHVGTTSGYWIYRPDPNLPKNVTTGQVRRDARGNVFLDPSRDLPVPAAFNTASPTIFVDPSVTTTPDTNGLLPTNATVFVGNSNGVLYALDALGVPTGGDTQAAFEASGDKFNGSLDVRRSAGHFKFLADGTTPDPRFNPADGFAPTPQPKWWFTLRGVDPNSPDNPSFADIESAPALSISSTVTLVSTNGNTYAYTPTVYIGSAHEMEATSNVGRLYALNGLFGPAGNNGTSDPTTTAGGPGSFNYNVGQRPQISNADTADWSFPDAYDRTGTGPTSRNKGQSSDKKARPALGNVTGSPVVFTNATNFNGVTHETNAARQTRIYFAANSGLETTTAGTIAATRPDEAQGGRLWAVNQDGSVGTTTNSNTGVWAYPAANDPNIVANDTKVEPSEPMGSFLHATPAMGFVQFPKIIQYNGTTNYTHADAVQNDIKGNSVPMLYVATRGDSDSALYAIDVDGRSDGERVIYREGSPDGSIFQSSPILITNASTLGGNGGAVFVTGGSTFYDYSATPISNPFTGQGFPLIRLNKTYTTFGPFSSPAVAATETTDLLTAVELSDYTAATGRTKSVTDWVYVGDSTFGFCRGFTPRDSGDFGIPADAFNALVPRNPNPPDAPDLSAPLQAYLVDETNKKSINYSDRIPFGPGTALPVYEWGQNVYIRFANVASPSTDPAQVVYDHTQPLAQGTIGYGGGGPLTFEISDATQGIGGAPASPPDRATIPPVLIAVPANNTPLPNGFIQRGDPTVDPENVLQDAAGHKYLGAYTYTISDGSARLNTPGSRRRVLNATQTVQVFTYDTGSNSFTPTPRTTKLVAFISNGNVVTKPDAGGNPSLVQVPPVDQPTFGILNPLGVRGGGKDLFGRTGTVGGAAFPIGDGLGPFRGISRTDGTIVADADDLKALANGNRIPMVAPPSSSGGGGTINPTKPLSDPANAAFNPATTLNVVVTATGMIPHNNSGDNFDAPVNPTTTNPTPTLPLFPPQGTGTSGDGLTTTNFGSASAPYALDLSDRSALGLIGQGIRAKASTFSSGSDAGLYWNDNTANVTGHDAVVNYLPWETPPPAGSFLNGIANSSQDYPNISASDISVILHPYDGGAADMTLGRAFLKRAFPGTGSDVVRSRTIYTNPVQVHVSVRRFQPANQQLYTEVNPYQAASGGSKYDPTKQVAPVNADGSTNSTLLAGDYTFPMGYATTRRIYVPDRTGSYRRGAAFREVRVYTGVPPDFGAQMSTATADVGKVPSGFGIQTAGYKPLTGVYPPAPANAPGTLDPYQTFDPYNPAFADYFKPLNVLNTGNVNLLNVHLDQKQLRPDPVNGTPKPFALPLFSDALDPTSLIPGYDPNGAVTGPRFGRFGASNTPEDFYLIRSSLDSDLVAPYGHNPMIQNPSNTNVLGVPLNQIYPGATFHKAQVGSAQPSTLFVPDAPESFTPGATLDVPETNHPTQQGDTSNRDANNNPLPFKTAPFVSVAVPFGTAVGSYHGALQLFEGLDSRNYFNGPDTTYTGLVAQIFPPRYGGQTGGIGAPQAALTDTIEIANSANGPIRLMPSSPNATVLNVNVVEDRMTDGATYGAVPMVDQGPAIPGSGNTPERAVPDFAPAAYRDLNSGNLSVYWTSGRGTGTNAKGPNAQFNIYQALVPMVKGASNSFAFLPVDPAATGTYVNQWWTSLASDSAGYTGTAPNRTLVPALAADAGTNSGLTIVQDAQNLATGTVGAFAVNVQAPPLTPSYQNTVLYYPVTPRTGALGSAVPVTNDPTQVKYGVKGLAMTASVTKFNRNLWAFWTATTRGRTAIYYNSQDPTNGLWVSTAGSPTPPTIGLLPIPAGLTAVADPAPLLLFGNVLVNGTPQLQATIEVTYSGTGPDGNVDLYQSRYQPDGDPKKPFLLDLVPYPAVSEILKATGQPGGWYQARDVAWSRTSQLNLFVGGQAILYDTTKTPAAPLFSRAVFDKASGLLVLTGVTNPALTGTSPTAYAFGSTSTPVTIYLDLATGRARFSAAPNATVTALFSPLARRLTDDSRADTGPATFLDGTLKANTVGNPVKADRRWYIWRKSGVGGASPSATIYYKTQRLTVFLHDTIDLSKSFSITLNGTAYSGPVDAYNVPAVLKTDGSVKVPASARLYFPIQSGAEGATFTITYSNLAGAPRTDPANADTVQWQDETRSNDTLSSTDPTAPPINATMGLAAINQGYAVPLDTTVNENNVAAFLDTDAYKNYYKSATDFNLSYPHKTWLFWNSTRNGTADLYYETINPLFAAGP